MRPGGKPLDLVFSRHAERELLDIPDEFRQRVKRDITALAQGTLPGGQVKKLHAFRPPVWQLTSGRFRVLFRREGECLYVLRVLAKPQQAAVFRTFR